MLLCPTCSPCSRNVMFFFYDWVVYSSEGLNSAIIFFYKQAAEEFGLRRNCVQRLSFFFCKRGFEIGISILLHCHSRDRRRKNLNRNFVRFRCAAASCQCESVCVGCAYINQCKRGIGMFCASRRGTKCQRLRKVLGFDGEPFLSNLIHVFALWLQRKFDSHWCSGISFLRVTRQNEKFLIKIK